MNSFWSNKKVLVTGHTGFKGSWLSLWLQQLGADVYGYALAPEDEDGLYHLAEVGSGMHSVYGDINDADQLNSFMKEAKPDIVFHLAAQPLVRLSYDEPVATFATNVMGTVHLLEAARHTESVQIVLNITSDKCYENPGDVLTSFRESDPMGGSDPYSASKGCAEIVTAAYAHSFYSNNGKSLASMRAGNVIGGGDWATDRIIPDLIRAAASQQSLSIRNPNAVRPWQHVLDCLNGYITLAEQLYKNREYAGSWNFGPDDKAVLSVSDLINQATDYLQGEVDVVYETAPQPYEAICLMLNSDKARNKLAWSPKLPVSEAIQWTIEWYDLFLRGEDMRLFTIQQINQFEVKEMPANVQPTMPSLR